MAVCIALKIESSFFVASIVIVIGNQGVSIVPCFLFAGVAVGVENHLYIQLPFMFVFRIFEILEFIFQWGCKAGHMLQTVTETSFRVCVALLPINGIIPRETLSNTFVRQPSFSLLING